MEDWPSSQYMLSTHQSRGCSGLWCSSRSICAIISLLGQTSGLPILQDLLQLTSVDTMLCNPLPIKMKHRLESNLTSCTLTMSYWYNLRHFLTSRSSASFGGSRMFQSVMSNGCVALTAASSVFAT